jgi:4'-phosphopantetheinyl transferase
MLYWLHCSLYDCPQLASSDPPTGLLHPREVAYFRQFTNPARRREWLLGRWTAKQLAHTYLHRRWRVLRALDLLPIAYDRHGAPYLTTPTTGAPLPLSLSIAHSQDHALALLLPLVSGTAGADIEQVRAWDPDFLTEMLTVAESEEVAACAADQRPYLITRLWSAKEAAVKALGLGWRLSPHQVAVAGEDKQIPHSHLEPACLAHWARLQITVTQASTSTQVAVCQRLYKGGNKVYVLSLAAVNAREA